MRSIWKGAITFGLVNVPVKVYSATEDHDVALHQVHDADGGRIRYQRRCEICGKVVEYEHIDKAYDDGGDHGRAHRRRPRSRCRRSAAGRSRSSSSCPTDQIDPIMFDRSYFLEPDKTAVKAYVLLRRTLEETDRTAIVQFALRQKTRLGALRVARATVLMLQTLLWDDEVREADFPVARRGRADLGAGAEDVRLAGRQLRGRLRARTSSPTTTRSSCARSIEAKLEQGDAVDTAATFGEERRGRGRRRRGDRPDGGPAAQRRAQPAARSGASSGATEPAKKTAAKKAAAKKTSGKTSDPKKSTAKKSTAKKSTNRRSAPEKSTASGKKAGSKAS